MLLHPLQTEWDAEVLGGDPLGFPGYTPPEEESVLTGRTQWYALIQGRFDVLGGSMGVAHGERVVRAYRRAADARLPVVVVATSGGARIQEGMLSLIQMARTAAAASSHAGAGLLQVAVLRGPTTGGVLASYAGLADVRAAEPGATVGFAGPRVVELVTGTRLSSASHTAESAYRTGVVDAVVSRPRQPAWVEAALGLGSEGQGSGQGPAPPVRPTPPTGGAWSEVRQARHPARLTGWGWAQHLCSQWTPLHAPDPCIRAGMATLQGRRLVVIAMDRNRPGPSGYRLARRAISLAARLGLEVLTLVDTPGAEPGPEAESAGIAGEIASTLAAMAHLPVPTVSVCVGEGGSGGALALAFADRLLMLEHAVFSVISPEGAAVILDRTDRTAPERAEQLKLTSTDLLSLGIIDAVIQETPAAVARAVARALGDARRGDRHRRFDAATVGWIR
ncbi:MAG: acetyl-CoA carboxylase carboxyl transferase subunit beta [Actinobacteria bacterium]|nr:acetyl-CoA carboxylase carboxyl transferase subunit beta [Actinomycetota bacterium]